MQTTNFQIKLPWGAEHERLRAERIAEGLSYVEVQPKLPLADVAALLAGAQTVVSVDTGLSHLTAALDRPNLTLFGPTDPGLIGGYGKNQQQIISPTGNMGDISPDAIFKTLLARL
jgi:heptosyltransferase-1